MTEESRASPDKNLHKLLSEAKKHNDAAKYEEVIRYISLKQGKNVKNKNHTPLSEEEKYHYFASTLQLARISLNKDKMRAMNLLDICSKCAYPEIQYGLGRTYLDLKDIENAKICLYRAARGRHRDAQLLLDKLDHQTQQTEVAKSPAQMKRTLTDSPKVLQKQPQNSTKTAQIARESNSDEDEWMIEYYDEIQKIAENGDKDAQFTLGYMYENGRGVEENLNTAILWYRRAIDQKHIEACCNLGYIYESLSKFENAVDLYTYAAKKKCVQAQYNLASCYARGLGTLKDDEKALYWFKKAADQQHHEAEANLGYIYWKNGKYRDAINYYSKAANSGILRARFALGYIYQTEKIDKKATEETFIMHAKSCYIYCDKFGYLPATNNLGYLFEKKGNIEEAKKYYKKAVSKNYAASQNNLGCLYMDSENMEEVLKAGNLLEQAEANGSKYAKANLQLLSKKRQKQFSKDEGSSTYFIKLNLKQDFKQAYRFFEELTKDQEGSLGWYELGLLDQYARPGTPDYKKALEHYLNAKDNPAALYQIATMYFLANGVNQDLDQAISYLEKVKEIPNHDITQFAFTEYNDTSSQNERQFNFCVKTRKELLAEVHCTLAYLYEHKEDPINTIKHFFLASYLDCVEAKVRVKDFINQQNLISINK